MDNLSEHWDKIFKKTETEKLGWYEKEFDQTLKFLNLIPKWSKLKIFIAGAGTSGLIEVLMKSKANLVINDISSEAIKKAQANYGVNENRVQWLCHDISKPFPSEISGIDIWLDRAVLHFLVDESSVKQYFVNLNAVIKIGGYAILAEFSKSGAAMCAGLNVKRYDVQELEKYIPNFELVKKEEYTFINPYGDPRPYIYTLFKRNA